MIRKIFILSVLFFFGSLSFADTNGDGIDSIILPDINLSIEDESELPLHNQDHQLSDEETPDLTRIDLEELANSGVSEKIRSELEEQRSDDSFSLSGFRFFYGSYGNLTTDINLGKSIGSFNYLITYLRNKRESTGFNGERYFNTELGVDDLGVDLIWSVGNQLDLNATLGYYERTLGLYTNQSNLSENLVHLPVKIGLFYRPDMNSSLSFSMNGETLSSTFKQPSDYLENFYWNIALDTLYQIDWSQHNFLKVQLKALYETNSQEAGVKFLDQFPVLSFFAAEPGVGIYFSSDDNFFWYPHVFLLFYPIRELNFKIGLTGIYHRFSIEDRMARNLIFYRDLLPERGWKGELSLAYTPIRQLTLRVRGKYEIAERFLNWEYSSSREVYFPTTLSNISFLTFVSSVESMIADWLVFTFSYTYRNSPDWDRLLFVHHHEVFGDLSLKYKKTGSELNTHFLWQDEVQNIHGTDAVKLNLEYIQKINRQFYLNIRLNNVLNQEVFEENGLPRGGFGFYGGLKILL